MPWSVCFRHYTCIRVLKVGLWLSIFAHFSPLTQYKSEIQQYSIETAISPGYGELEVILPLFAYTYRMEKNAPKLHSAIFCEYDRELTSDSVSKIGQK